MSDERLQQCHWPPLASPYAEALRDVVAFVFAEVDPVGIIATGTIVRGSPHAASDLDVYVIHDAPYRRRIQRIFRGVATEIFINPSAMIRRYFAEEHNDARPISAHMIATGQVVFESQPVVRELRREAAEWLVKPFSLSDEQRVRAKYAVATRFEDAIDVAGHDPDTATMLITQAVTSMLELDCRIHDGRVPRSKELLGTIARRNPDLGRLAHAFFSATSYADRQKAAESIADLTIGVRGFFEWDSGRDPIK